MEKHPFENTHRVPARDASALQIAPWSPPMIDAAGHLVQVELRQSPRRENAQPGDGDDMDGQKGYNEGFAQGRSEGINAGKEEGLAAGKREGNLQAQQELKPKLSQLNSLLTSISHSLNQEDYKLEQTLMQLVRVIAEAVIRRELQSDPKHIMKVIKETLSGLPPSRDNIRVLINPADKKLVDEAISHGGENWSAIADDDISRGGCRIETDQSAADFTIEGRIDAVLEQIYEQQAVSPRPGDAGFESAPEPAVSARPQAHAAEPAQETGEGADSGGGMHGSSTDQSPTGPAHGE